MATVVHPIFYRELNKRSKIITKLPYKPMISLFDKKEIAIMLKTNGSRWSSCVFALATLLNYALMVICTGARIITTLQDNTFSQMLCCGWQ